MTILANPNAANRTITTYVSGLDADGIPLVIGNQEIESWRANAAITRGQALMFVAPTASVPMSVTPMTAAVTASDPWRFAGVAMNTVAADAQVRVCCRGFCEVFIDASATAAAYSLLQAPGTTTGRFNVATDPVDNSIDVGQCFGIETGTTDRCLAYINRDGILRRFEAGA